MHCVIDWMLFFTSNLYDWQVNQWHRKNCWNEWTPLNQTSRLWRQLCLFSIDGHTNRWTQGGTMWQFYCSAALHPGAGQTSRVADGYLNMHVEEFYNVHPLHSKAQWSLYVTFTIIRSAHTVYLCVLCGSDYKQRLFHCTALTDWLVFITETECVYCAVRTESLNTGEC